MSDHPDPGNRYAAINREAQYLNVSKTPIKLTRDFERIKASFRRMPPARSMAQIQQGPPAGNVNGGRYPSGGDQDPYSTGGNRDPFRMAATGSLPEWRQPRSVRQQQRPLSEWQWKCRDLRWLFRHSSITVSTRPCIYRRKLAARQHTHKLDRPPGTDRDRVCTPRECLANRALHAVCSWGF